MQSEKTNQIEVDLSAPGAGLPKIELSIVRFIFARTCRKWDHTKTTQVIASEHTSLTNLVRQNSPEKNSQRALIKRFPGLEDSSRYWSVYMTLDHLKIVNQAVTHVISELSSGHLPSGESNTATLKPRPNIGDQVIAEFDQSCRDLMKVGRKLKPTTLRYDHPWFGPLDTHKWYVMAGFHMRVHHKQINRILKTFNS